MPIANTTAFTADFQDLITRYAWGEIWSRPGLDRRTRSCITITALVATGASTSSRCTSAQRSATGVTPDELKEVLLQCAVYCGVPAANGAFAIAQRVLDEDAPLSEPHAGRRSSAPAPPASRSATCFTCEGIDSVILEDRSREYVEARVRAGVIEQGIVDLLTAPGRREAAAARGSSTTASSSSSPASATGSP